MTDLDEIPSFLKREGVPMSTVAAETQAKKPKASKPATEALAKALGTNPLATASKPAVAPAKAATAPASDVYGYREGTIKSKAAAMYAAKSGATLDEVKKAPGSVQLNLLKDLEGKGLTVKRVKEPGAGARQVTRYFLTK